MKILIGTDILLCYLLKADYIDGIHLLINWLDKIKAEKIIDISSVAILTNFAPISEFDKLYTFIPLKIVPPLTSKIYSLKSKIKNLLYVERKSANTALAHLNLLDTNNVDYLITENEQTHLMSQEIGLDSRVYTIESFIEKCSIEYRHLDETKGAIVQICKFGSLSIKDPFFGDFKREYNPYFMEWFRKKADDDVFISTDKKGRLKALLKLKIEDETEDYSDICPVFQPLRRLKISSLKVNYNGQKLGERFMRIIFQTALINQVEEIYITIFNNNKARKRLINMITTWGFENYGEKESGKLYNELVYVKKMKYTFKNDIMKNFPMHHIPNHAFIIPLNKTYVYQLLPQDTLFEDKLDIMPTKRAIKKIVILNDSSNTEISSGDCLLFYQNSLEKQERKLLAVGIVEYIYKKFETYQEFYNRCRKRSILSNEELTNYWIKANREPVVIEFLYIYGIESFNIDNNDLEMNEINTSQITSQTPIKINIRQYLNLLKKTSYEMYLTTN